MERTMAWVTNENFIELKESEIPQLKSDEILIKIKYSAICGSDMHLYHGIHPFVNIPSTIGHELVGIVVKMGDCVKKLNIGDAVVPESILVCGNCAYCLKGNYHMCESVSFGYREGQAGFTTYYICSERWAHKIPYNVSFESGVLVEPLSVAIHGVDKAGDLMGKTVVVFGAGAIGAFAAEICRIKGAAKIIIADINVWKLEFVTKAIKGCISVNTKIEKIEDLVNMETGGLGCDVVIECTGSSECINSAVNVVCKMGMVIQLGITTKPLDGYKYSNILSKEITLKGSQGYCFDFEKAISIISTGIIDVSKYITEVYNFLEIQSAFNSVSSPESKNMKILISYD